MKMQQAEVISREFVKPSSKIHPKIHNLSFFDQILPQVYVPLIFFYTNENGVTDQQISSLLKISLSAALSRYYPLAGRIVDDSNFYVDCNDNGVLFLEERMRCKLSQFLNKPQVEFLRLLIPANLSYKDSSSSSPVVVKVTYFKCGGISIGLCMCHKILDMSSISTFLNDWASLARNSPQEIKPEFNLGSLYPPLDLPFLKQKQRLPPGIEEFVWGRFVFHGEKIAKLKAMVADHVPNPTRTEVVTALIYKSVVNAAAKASSSGSIKPSVMNNPMDFRAKVRPPLSERNIGNVGWLFSVSIREEKEAELGHLVKEFRLSKNQLSSSCANASNREEVCSLILNGLKPMSEYLDVEHEVYTCSSVCSFPVYEADFGWGKPLWVAIMNLKNQITLYNSREGDGIEAFMSLEEEVMAVFEKDEELLSFCKINPSVMDLESRL